MSANKTKERIVEELKTDSRREKPNWPNLSGMSFGGQKTHFKKEKQKLCGLKLKSPVSLDI